MAKIAILEGFDGYGRHRRRRRGSSKLGRAARHCRGKTKGKFRKCIRNYMKRH